MKEENKKIAIYCRTATKDKKQMKEQKTLLKKYCEENNYKDYIIYEDYGYSGKNLNRPRYNMMMNDLKLNKIDKIIVTNFNKLTRSIIEINNLNSELDKYNCELICTQLNNINNLAQIVYKNICSI